MTKANLTIVFILLNALFCLAQQNGASFRNADAFHGRIRTIRVEGAQLKSGSSGELVEGSAVLYQLITYSEDGLTRTAVSYNGEGSVFETWVDTYLPDGKRTGTTVTGKDGIFMTRLAYEYDGQGHMISETWYNSDGSVKDKVLTQTIRLEDGDAVHTKTNDDGLPADVTAFVSRDVTKNKSTSTTTRPDGSRTEDSFEIDKSGTHHSESITYKADGSVARRSVSIIDARLNRVETTEYSGDGTVRRRSLETREYDSFRNLVKNTSYRWNADSQNFEPLGVTYNRIIYRD